MDWKFWKQRKKNVKEVSKQRSTRTNSADRFSHLPKSYAQQQILALQRTVGNRAVLRLLGVSDDVAASNFGAARESAEDARSFSGARH